MHVNIHHPFSFVISFQENCDMEYKFNRTKMWSIYFAEGSTLPPPYNIFPSLKSVITCCKMIRNFFKRRSNKYQLKMVRNV